MRFIALPIPGAFSIELEKKEDERGFFARTFCANEFRAYGLATDFVQHSISFNRHRGTLRGLHYQSGPYGETKLVRCTAGVAFDVLVDIRRNSRTFGLWHGVTISAENHLAVYIPEGCAHGFQTLVDATELAYEITPAYVPLASRGIAFDDPGIGISWPIENPILSAADRAWPRLDDQESAG